MREAYSARELSVTRAEPLIVLWDFAGWLLVRSGAGAQGWIPITAVERGTDEAER